MPPNLRAVFGIALIVLGVIAIPIPILPGTPLIAAGAALLGRSHPLIRFFSTWLRKRGLLKKESSEG